jgi:hypothetical protein
MDSERSRRWFHRLHLQRQSPSLMTSLHGRFRKRKRAWWNSFSKIGAIRAAYTNTSEISFIKEKRIAERGNYLTTSSTRPRPKLEGGSVLEQLLRDREED